MDDNDRTSAFGLFAFAHSYAASAVSLAKAPPPGAIHAGAPVDFLVFHAIELYLKAFLRARGFSVAGMKKIGHRLTGLRNKAQELGLPVQDENGVIDLAEMSMMERRYIVTGAKQRHPDEIVFEVCRHLHHEVGEALRSSGLAQRLPPISSLS